MRAKYWTKRMLSGVLSAVMVLSVAAGPVSALASDTKTDPKKNLEEYVSSLPDLDDARDSLDRDEIVTAKDLELDYGAEIDLKKDYTGIRIPDKKKISVSFYEAKNEDGKSFSTSRADTYKAVYYAEPVNTEHPAYRFSRNITVREEMKEKAAAKSPATETGGTASKAESVTSSGKASAGDSGESTESEEDTETDSSAKASEEAVLKTAGFDMTADQYAAALKGSLLTQEQAGEVNAAVEARMQGEAFQARTEAAVQEQIEKLTAENTEDYLAKDETIAAKLNQAAAALEQLTALKGQLEQVNTFVTGLKDYTDGVAQASGGAATLSAGALLVSAGASALQETGTQTLKDSILTAEKGAAEKLLPLVEKDLAGALSIWNAAKDHLANIGYDLRPEGMAAETVYIIRTDLK